MSLQGPIIVVADTPSDELVAALGEAGAFPIIEASWTDAPTAFVSVKPCAVVIAEPGPPPSETSARMLCLQIATASGPTVPVIARTSGEEVLPVPIALAANMNLPVERLITRLRTALRVRALHSTVLRRIESFGAEHGKLPELPVGDALDDATVMIVGRGPLYPALSVAIGERVGLLGALSVETAARHLNSRDIDGIVIGDGLNQRMVEAFLTVLAQDDRFRNIPVSVIGDIPADLAERLPHVDRFRGTAANVVARMIPPVRLHAFAARLKRMLAALESNGIIDPQSGLLAPDAFWQELNKAVRDSGQQGHALTIGRFSFDGDVPDRARKDAARLATRLVRDSDFGCCEDDGGILIAFGQTDLRSAHLIARRIAAVLRNTMLAPGITAKFGPVTANVTLATLKGTDTLDSLMLRVNGGEVVAAE
jgi:hypothetical protein